MSNVTNLPDKSVVIDLDTIERPADQKKPPFVVNFGGRKITMADPDELDWRDLLAVEQPTDFLRIALSREDRDHFAERKLEAWRFGKLLEAYYAHYDLDEKLSSARRRGNL